MSDTAKSIVYFLVAIALTCVYFAAIYILYIDFVKVDPATGKGSWDHALVLFGGISSIGFTAIGVLLGTKVQQVNVAEAKADAKAKGDANRNALDTLSGMSDAEGGGGAGDTAVARAIRILTRAQAGR